MVRMAKWVKTTSCFGTCQATYRVLSNSPLVHPLSWGAKPLIALVSRYRVEPILFLALTKNGHQPGVTVASSIDESLELARAEQPEKVSIIGGGQIYKLFLPFATILEITYVYDAPVADTYFPNFSEDDFTEIKSNRSTRQPTSF